MTLDRYSLTYLTLKAIGVFFFIRIGSSVKIPLSCAFQWTPMARQRLLHFQCCCTGAVTKGTLSTVAKWSRYLGLDTSGSLQHNVHSCTLLWGRLGINAEVLNLHFFLKVQVWLLDALKNQSTEGHHVGWIRDVRLWFTAEHHYWE